MAASYSQGDVSPELRKRTFQEGQAPYAIILACSDSRVIPEAIFSAGHRRFVRHPRGRQRQQTAVSRAASNTPRGIWAASLWLCWGTRGAAPSMRQCTTSRTARSSSSPTRLRRLLATSPTRPLRAWQTSRTAYNASRKAVSCIATGLPHGLRVVGALYHTDTGEVQFLD